MKSSKLNVWLKKRLQGLRPLALLLRRLHESRQREKLPKKQSVSSKSASLLRNLLAKKSIVWL